MSTGRSALVLGGGGVTGIAWELGILAGLADAGVDLTDADIVIGTSAGSVVGAQICSGHALEELYAAQLRPAAAELGAHFSRLALLKLAPPLLVPGSPRAKRKRIGTVAMRAHAPDSADRAAVIRSRLPLTEWPDRDLRITAVEAETGTSTVFHHDSGVDIIDAVAASCAVPTVWPPVAIGGRHYIDGGMRSTANVDLARGADRVVVLAPLPRALSRRTTIRAQLAQVAPRASKVVVPDERALADIGANVLDPAKRADAARTGRRQAATLVDRVAAVWG